MTEKASKQIRSEVTKEGKLLIYIEFLMNLKKKKIILKQKKNQEKLRNRAIKMGVILKSPETVFLSSWSWWIFPTLRPDIFINGILCFRVPTSI